jgi:hypothetical protein
MGGKAVMGKCPTRVERPVLSIECTRIEFISHFCRQLDKPFCPPIVPPPKWDVLWLTLFESTALIWINGGTRIDPVDPETDRPSREESQTED